VSPLTEDSLGDAPFQVAIHLGFDNPPLAEEISDSNPGLQINYETFIVPK
jgi:hypothetical protein